MSKQNVYISSFAIDVGDFFQDKKFDKTDTVFLRNAFEPKWKKKYYSLYKLWISVVLALSLSGRCFCLILIQSWILVNRDNLKNNGDLRNVPTHSSMNRYVCLIEC